MFNQSIAKICSVENVQLRTANQSVDNELMKYWAAWRLDSVHC